MLNDKQRKQILELHKQGHKITVIAMTVGCREDEVSKTAIMAGFRRQTRCKHIKERDENIAADYLAGVKVSDISKKYGLEQTNIYRSLKRQGVTYRRCVGISSKNKRFRAVVAGVSIDELVLI
jgi:hypothetical protein